MGKETIETVITMSTEAAQEGYKNASAYGKERLDAAKDGYEKAAAEGKLRCLRCCLRRCDWQALRLLRSNAYLHQTRDR